MATDLQALIAGEVRAEMARRGTTQEELARRLGTDQAVVSRKLTGGSPFTTRDIERWAAALGVPVTQLLPGITVGQLLPVEPAGGTR